MKEILVRVAEIKDASQLAKIHVETWQCAYKGQIPEDYLSSLSVEQRTKRWEEILNNPKSESKTFVAELNNHVVGFTSIGPCKDEDMSSKTGELWSIYVDKNSMGKGVGSALMKKGLGSLKEQGYKKATLWVLTSNEKTRKWYESKGWRVEGKVKNEQSRGFDIHETRYIIAF